MKENRTKELSSKQVKIISICISAAYCIISLIRGFAFEFTKEDAIFYWTIVSVIGTIAVYLICYFQIFKGEERKRRERLKERKEDIRRYLSFTEYKRVHFVIDKNANDQNKIIDAILKSQKCKCYVRLNSKHNINLVIRNNQNEKIYKEEIENLDYFTNNFTLEKC